MKFENLITASFQITVNNRQKIHVGMDEMHEMDQTY